MNKLLIGLMTILMMFKLSIVISSCQKPDERVMASSTFGPQAATGTDDSNPVITDDDGINDENDQIIEDEIVDDEQPQDDDQQEDNNEDPNNGDDNDNDNGGVVVVVTYLGTIKQIIDNACVPCHSAQGQYPAFPLETYDQVKAGTPQALLRIKDDVAPMPPSASPEQRAAIAAALEAWAAQGYPLGTAGPDQGGKK
jgi:hypothetical protein